MSEVSGKTAVVVGASRGIGRGVATAFAKAGARVVAVSRSTAALADLAVETGTITPEVADAADPSIAGSLLDRHEPDILILVAGASPLMRPLQQQTWETFSAPWETDVKIAFHWLREALLRPLRPGSRVVVFSSGAALAGSPLSGGYAGAKATQRFITGYAQEEAHRDGLDITFTTILPRPTPATEIGQAAARAYAARSGQTEDEFIGGLGGVFTPDEAGAAVVDLIRQEAAQTAAAYLLAGGQLKKIPG